MVVDSVSVVLGDLNGDSLVSFADIPPFIDALIDGVFVPEGDVDQNGALNFSDIPAFIALLQM